MNKEEAKDQLIKLLESQIMDLTLMSKIELGDDVIEEIQRLKALISNTEPYISDDFQIGPNGAFEHNDEENFKIEERQLTYSERYKYWFLHNFETGMEYCEDIIPDFNSDYYEPTPTKIIKITYNDGLSIETYE